MPKISENEDSGKRRKISTKFYCLRIFLAGAPIVSMKFAIKSSRFKPIDHAAVCFFDSFLSNYNFGNFFRTRLYQLLMRIFFLSQKREMEITRSFVLVLFKLLSEFSGFIKFKTLLGKFLGLFKNIWSFCEQFE